MRSILTDEKEVAIYRKLLRECERLLATGAVTRAGRPPRNVEPQMARTLRACQMAIQSLPPAEREKWLACVQERNADVLGTPQDHAAARVTARLHKQWKANVEAIKADAPEVSHGRTVERALVRTLSEGGGLPASMQAGNRQKRVTREHWRSLVQAAALALGEQGARVTSKTVYARLRQTHPHMPTPQIDTIRKYLNSLKKAARLHD